MSLTLSKDLIDWSNPINWGHPLNRGLVSWWLAVPGRNGWGTNRWRDIVSKSQQHGTLANMDTAASWGPSLQFFGTNDYVGVTSAIGQTDFAVEIVLSTSTDCGIYQCDTGRASTTVDRGLRTTSGNLTCRLFSNESVTTSGVTVTDGNPHHVVYEFGPSYAQRISVDGVQRAIGTKTSSSYAGDNGLTIGFYNDAPTKYFTGHIYSFRLYNRATKAAFGLYSEYKDGYRGLLNRIPRTHYSEQAATGSPWHYYHQQAIACSREEGI